MHKNVELYKIYKSTYLNIYLTIYLFIFFFRTDLKTKRKFPIPGVNLSSLSGVTILNNVWGDLFVICCPPHSRRQSKFPSGGTNIEKSFV